MMREACDKCTGEGFYRFSGGRVSEKNKMIAFLFEGLIHTLLLTFRLHWLRRKVLRFSHDVLLTDGGDTSTLLSFLCYFCPLSLNRGQTEAFYWSACEMKEARVRSTHTFLLFFIFFKYHFGTLAFSLLAKFYCHYILSTTNWTFSY